MTTKEKIFLNRILIRLAEWHNEDILQWNEPKNIPLLKAQYAAWLDVRILLNRNLR